MSGTVPAQLPNAPLAEVVFELRWELEGGGDKPSPVDCDLIGLHLPTLPGSLGFRNARFRISVAARNRREFRSRGTW